MLPKITWRSKSCEKTLRERASVAIFCLQLDSEFLQTLKEMKFLAVILAAANALSDSAANYLMVNELNL